MARGQLKVAMPKSKANNAIQIGQRSLVDAAVMGAMIGFTPQYINRLAAAGRIPWHGVQNGAKVYRRYDPQEVLEALKHEVDAPQSAPKLKRFADRK